MRLRFLVVLGLLCGSPAEAQSHCLDYEAKDLELRGRLARKVFPGPPNYESIKRGDQPDTIWMLRLDRAICVNRRGEFLAQSRVREVQLIPSEHDVHNLRIYLDRQVLFRGTLRGAEQGWHHLPVVFWAQLRMVDVRIGVWRPPEVELVLPSALSAAPARFACWRFVMIRSQHNAGR